MKKLYKYIDGYLSPDSLYQKTHPLQDAAFGADCLTPLEFFSIGLKNGSGNAVKNPYIL